MLDPAGYSLAMRFGYHTHTDFCDGKASAAAMAQVAWEKGYSYLGFSSHAPLPFETDWNIPRHRLLDYGAVVRTAAAEWAPMGLTIFTGLEADFLEGSFGPGDEAYDSIKPDFLIGSVHFLSSLGDEPFAVDEPAEEFAAHVNDAVGKDHEKIWRRYYRDVSALILRGGFDFIGHFDLVRKNNGRGIDFDDHSEPYLKAAFEAIDVAAEADSIVEINTGGMARGKLKDTYPSLRLLKRMKEKRLRITIGDDAHAPAHLGDFQERAIAAAREAGFSSLWYLARPGDWREIGIDEAGIPAPRG